MASFSKQNTAANKTGKAWPRLTVAELRACLVDPLSHRWHAGAIQRHVRQLANKAGPGIVGAVCICEPSLRMNTAKITTMRKTATDRFSPISSLISQILFMTKQLLINDTLFRLTRLAYGLPGFVIVEQMPAMLECGRGRLYWTASMNPPARFERNWKISRMDESGLHERKSLASWSNFPELNIPSTVLNASLMADMHWKIYINQKIH